MPAASAMPGRHHARRRHHATCETATAAVGETYTTIDAATHAMAEALAEFAVTAIVGAVG